MRMKALLALLGIGLGLLLFAGCSDNDNTRTTRTVTGTVTNVAGAPVGGATVQLFQGNTLIATTTTNSSGQFTFTNVNENSNFTVRVSSPTNDFAPSVSPAFTVSGNTTRDVVIITNTELNTLFAIGPPAAGTATLVAFFTDGAGNIIGGTVQIDAETPTTSTTGPVVVTNIAPQTADVSLTPSGGATTTIRNVTFAADTIYVVGNPVTPPSGTTTVSGFIGTIDPAATFTVRLKQNNNLIQTTSAGPAVEPTFTFNNAPTGNGFTVEVTNNSNNFTTIFGPFTIPSTGVSDLRVNTKSAGQLADEGVTGSIPPTNGQALLVVYDASTVQIDSQTPSTPGNPTFLRVAPGTYTIQIVNESLQTVTMQVTLVANSVTIVRPDFLL